MKSSLRLDADAEQVYVAMLQGPELDLAGLVAETELPEPRVRAALDSLADLDLLRQPEDEAGGERLIPPHVGYGQLIAAAERRLAEQQAELGAAKVALAKLSSEHHSQHEREAVVHLSSLESIRDRLAVLAENCRTECLSFSPGKQSPEAIEASKPLNEAALERGVVIRFVYVASVRHDVATRDYARWLTERGGEARTAPVVPHQMVVVDREVAILPSPDGGALEVHSPGVVAALVSHFETVWAHGQQLGHETEQDADGLTAQQRELFRLLAGGDTDATAARKLDVSLRTVRRMMAELHERLGARSRLEAGVLAERAGWLND